MDALLLLPTLITFAFALLFYWKFTDERNKNLWLQGKFHPYQRKKRFLTGNEKRLFELLQTSDLTNDYYIFPQLHLSTILEVKDEAIDLDGKFTWLNKLYVDFVLFTKESLEPAFVIELNDSTHLWITRKARDEYVKLALEANDILLRFLSTNELTRPAIVLDQIKRAISEANI